jgi:hypothetical protein
LLIIDAAVLLLTDDDLTVIRPHSETAGSKVSTYLRTTPRDNVIFEVGAIMSRVGMKRTLIVAPDLETDQFRILDYLAHFKLIRYPKEPIAGTEWTGVMKTVADAVVDRLATIGEHIYHSDLPALGLCYGYFHNFINPVMSCLQGAQSLEIDGEKSNWEPANGCTLTLAIPRELMGGRDAKQFLGSTLQLASTSLRFKDGRNPGVFVLRREAGAPLHVIDIPTTLFTSKSVIDRVDRYWTEQDDHAMDSAFVAQLAQREIVAFRRQLGALIKENLSAPPNIHLVSLDDLPAHLKGLPAR